MATYKLEVQKEFGKLHHRVFPTGAAAPEWGPACDNKDALIEKVAKSLETVSFNDGDTVIFRNIAYASPDEITNTVRFSTF